jgi:triphosphoribosyl-dephospho-CoA synthase
MKRIYQHTKGEYPKGIIFLMGLSLFACGYLFGRQDMFSDELFRQVIKQICRDLTSKELGKNDQAAATHGEETYRKYGASGARGEAEGGFPMVFEFGLPELVRSGQLNDETMLKAFLAIAAHNQDTNIYTEATLSGAVEEFKSLSFDIKPIHCR